jgi:hypothetical protein
MRFWAGVLTALLLHALLLAGTRGCRVSSPGPAATEVGVVVAPPPPTPPPPVDPPAPAPPAPAAPRVVRPRPAPPRRAGVASLVAGALRPSLTESDFVVAGDSAATSLGLGQGAASGAGLEGPVEGPGEDEVVAAHRPGCREGDFGGIWVVDDHERLAAFDPETGKFRLVGLLRCDPRAPYEDHTQDWDAHPYSMTVDRAGRAWVLYTSGELFRVSTANAACSRTSWVPGRSGYELFALGYVADRQGRERLYIAGGKVAELNRGEGRIAVLDQALEPHSLGPYPPGELGPELTGTADGELYAFYVGEKLVALEGTRARATYRLPDVARSRTQSWAFAEWGGAFYLFANEGGTNQVLRFEPASGRVSTVVGAAPYRVVGAGVSGCSPLTPASPGSSPSPAPPAP